MTTIPSALSAPKPVEILLVEDSRIDRMLTVEALREFRVMNTLHCVEDGEAAMAFLRREGLHANAPRPDLILLDLNLPRKDGREVLAEIKADASLRQIPVVVLTTSSSEEDLVEAYGAHANCFITKPIDLDQFGRVARSLENFWFEVVTLPPAAAAVAATPSEMKAGAGAQGEAGACRVLLVEDSPTDALLLEAALRESKAVRFEVERVERLSAAIERLRAHCYDVVVADLNLPDSDGPATVRRVRRAAGDTPVIVLTIVDDEQTGRELLHEGAKDCLVKGELGGRALARAIRQAMDRGRIEAQLRHAQRMESVGVLAGGVAHDFNNLLTIIRGNAELISASGRDPAVEAWVRHILAAADRGATLTRQLLTYSRRERLRTAALELNHTVGEMADMLRRMLGPAIKLDLCLSAEALPMEADAGLIEQVVMNLAINAREVMPNGGTLRIATSRVELLADGAGPHPPAGPGAYACLAVSDTGTGISAEVLPHIFEPFFTTKEPGRGTGLGLATVYGAAQQHRGAVDVFSEPGRGAEFRVWLPLSGAAGSEPPFVAEVAKNSAEDEDAKGALILLVDDEEMVREMAAMALQTHGYEVVMAGSGEEALKRWPELSGRVALLLTDLLMPGMSGRDLARGVLEQSPGLPVIYSSGFHDAGMVREMQLKEGANFVAKPYALEALIGTVRRALAARAARAARGN